MNPKHAFALTFAAVAIVASPPADARSPYAGHYRIAIGPDGAGRLELDPDGHFRYELSAGALDERAEGTWTEIGGDIRLTTAPKPIPPSFARGPDGGKHSPTLHVRLADGRDLAGIDFRLGLTNGTVMAGYTQAEGWAFPDDGDRRIAWVEVVEPIYGIASPRFAIDPPAAGGLVFVLTPNEIELVDFQNAQLEKRTDDFLLHRRDRTLRLIREKQTVY